jgi:anthranilate synthase component 1
LFGYFTHEAVEHYETIRLKKSDDTTRKIPVMQYNLYRYIIAIDHFKNELYTFSQPISRKAKTEKKGISQDTRPDQQQKLPRV